MRFDAKRKYYHEGREVYQDNNGYIRYMDTTAIVWKHPVTKHWQAAMRKEMGLPPITARPQWTARPVKCEPDYEGMILARQDRIYHGEDW